jgi:hypothetical protein
MTTFLAALPLLTLVAAAGTPVTIDGLTSTAPASWKEQPPKPMRFKQFTVPHAAGDQHDGEVVIFFFGPGQGGDATANLNRWKAMFVPPEGKKIDDVSKIETIKVNGIEVTILDVHGSYKWKPSMMSPEEELRPNHRMLSVIFASPQGPYFIRFVGPEKTVEKNKKDFDKWLRGFKK